MSNSRAKGLNSLDLYISHFCTSGLSVMISQLIPLKFTALLCYTYLLLERFDLKFLATLGSNSRSFRYFIIHCSNPACSVMGRVQLKRDGTRWHREGKWRGNWRMEWVGSIFHTTSEHGVSSINTVERHTSAASSRLNWRPRRFKWTRPFRRKTKYGFCACAITFQMQSTRSLSQA